ncbi:sigma-70 family RNA polymerase sigma factor [Methylocaldum sp.]|uniref:sigma-70 family RNA polymerase sigma factor n=1 Tax=Methylocaldum sp. TaxID=1969727 RepID=UPI002D6D7682|nr:sigma-70 family RNA polymerase sigma factor [Methylocaldum sp.]HYE37358.1 sigma-70 family RNA polymerase sigma factor [Methylocaldum sp.]
MTTLSDPADWLDLYGDTLYRYALFRIHDEQLAEDLVQETLLAALKASERYTGNASEKTWLIGILKHKIIDLFRKSSHETAENVDDEAIYQSMEACFDEQGHWQIDIGKWSRPEKALEQEQFWRVLSDCVERMPPRLARLFVLREIEGMESDEVLEIMQVSTTNNLWVMLSRMRLQLRNCLDVHWFHKSTG